MEIIDLLKTNRILLIERINNNYKKIILKKPRIMFYIYNNTVFLSPTATLKERLYCITNNIKQRIKCKQCKLEDVKFQGTTYGYTQFCSPKCAQMNNETRNNHKQTMLKRYGVEHAGQTEEQKDKRKQTNIERFGCEHHWKNKKIQQKRKKTFKKKYNVSNPKQIHLADKLSYLNDEKWLIEQHHNEQKSLIEISNQINVDPTTIGNYLRKYKLSIYRHSVSQQEKEIINLLQQCDVECISNDRTIIYPQELDIFIPNYKLAIEYNGLYWHSEQAGKNKWYHYNKWKKCNEQGIQLIQIFEDEWLYRNQQVKQKLLSLLNKDNRRKIFARKCHIVNVTTGTKRQFFEDNHIQGDGPSSINIGLMHDNKLVACMGFIKQKNQHYLNRYATSAHVIGGFSKLLKYFQNNYQWNKLISFADLRWSDGNLYKRTGWKLDSILKPDYFYSPGGKQRIHKFNYRRKNLPKLLETFDPNHSEWQNCKNNGILRIWDCGKQKWTISL